MSVIIINYGESHKLSKYDGKIELFVKDATKIMILVAPRSLQIHSFLVVLEKTVSVN